MSDYTISSDESKVSNSYLNSTFRVRVNLAHYFDDVRARSYILVGSNHRVRWLQERLRKVFSLPGAFCLCANGHLLPPTEPLGLLKPEDGVEVIPLQDGQFKGRNVGNALVLSINKEKHDAKAITPSELLLDGPDIAYNGIVLEPGYFNNHIKKKNNHKTMNIEISGNDYVDGVKEPTVVEYSESNMECLDSCRDASVYTDLNVLDEPLILQKYKQHALTLLESCYGSEEKDYSVKSEETPPKRARRRVRKRARRGACGASQEGCGASQEGRGASQEGRGASQEGRGASQEGRGASQEGREASPRDAGAVARNDMVCPRKPRLVQSLDMADVKLD